MWKEEDNRLIKRFQFKDFVSAITFMVEASFHIEKMNHHPEWTNVYNKLTITLTTHDEGNTITEKDRKLATALDRLFERYI